MVETASPSLGRAAARGGLITVGSQIGRVVIQAIALVVLARLLEPSDFGVFAMVLVIVGLGELLRDMGLSNAAIQARSLSREQRDNLFWLSFGLGVLLGGILVALAPALAAFYGTPELADVARWLGIAFVLNGFASQYRASLVRDMRFGVTATLDVASAAVGLVVGIGGALAGLGFWALVAQELAKCLVLATGMAVAGRWLPRRPRRRTGIGPLVRYGANLVGTQLLGYASRNVDTVVLGTRFGAVVAGIYSRAYQLMALPITQLSHPTTKVALPVLARLQDDPERYRRFLLRGQTLVLHLVIPAFALSAVLADPVVRIFLGPQWGDAAPIFRILALGGIFEAASFTTMWVFLSKGATGAQLRFALVTRPLMIASIIIASSWGVEAVAMAYAGTTALLWPIGLWWISRTTDAPVGALLRNAGRALIGYGSGGLVAGVAVRALPVQGAWHELGVGLVVLAAMITVVTLVWPAFRADLRGVWEVRTLMLSRRSGPDREEAS